MTKVNPQYTSQRCSKCGAINQDLKLHQRIWTCSVCGAVHDRSLGWSDPSDANVGQEFERSPRIDESRVSIDNTWRTLDPAYLGVVFSISYLRKTLVTLETYGILEYPNIGILKDGFPEGALKKMAGLLSMQRPATMAMQG